MYRLEYMGTTTIEQGQTRVDVTARLFEDGGVGPGGSFWGPIVGEGDLSVGDASFRFHDGTEGHAHITRLPACHRVGKFRGTGELGSFF